jgi:FkbM family methyltransferase
MKARFLYRAWKTRIRESHEIRALRRALRPGDVAVDVGANKGAYLYWLRRAVGPSGRIHAFEPQPRLAAYLAEVSRRMDWSNVIVRPCALSDGPGVGTLHVPGESDSPGASLETAPPNARPGRSYDVPVETLDRELANVDRLAFVKVDVEGHELAVFRGAAALLARCAPTLLFECEERHLTAHTTTDVFAYLEGFGYRGFFLSPSGPRPLADFDPTLHQKRRPGRFWKARDYCNNFLFLPRA